jgi:hypothetical protein
VFGLGLVCYQTLQSRENGFVFVLVKLLAVFAYASDQCGILQVCSRLLLFFVVAKWLLLCVLCVCVYIYIYIYIYIYELREF